MRKIILFGDSITAGYEDGITDFRLNEEIEEKYPDLEVINAGIPGDTTAGALLRVATHVLRYEPDLITIFFGANDVSILSGISIDTYEENLVALIKKIGAEKIILIGVPFANQVYYEKERPLSRIQAYNQRVEKIASKYHINYINLLDEMQRREPLTLIQEDGLHFSRLGYKLLGELINEEIRKKEEK